MAQYRRLLGRRAGGPDRGPGGLTSAPARGRGPREELEPAFAAAVQGNLGAALQSLRGHSEAIEAYRRACEFEFNDCNPRLRMNLATALEAGGDPKGTLVELVRARWALRRQRWRELPGGVDREALVSVLSNAASIASRPFYGRRPVRSS